MAKDNEILELEKKNDESVVKANSTLEVQLTTLPEEAFSRIADAQLLRGNSVRLLKDAKENYPAWLDAIEKAEKFVHFESYIIHEDEQGKLFADALIKKAREGVSVRLIYDWMGGFGKTSRKFWNNLMENGIEVRCYNPFSFARPLGWVSRDHRKTLIVDGKIAFVTGLCIGQMWVGDAEKNVEPWRDTGVELHGKAVAEVSQAFADVWKDMGKALPASETAKSSFENTGDKNLRVVATKPGNAKTYRLDQMIGALAKKNLWLTDAYFAGTSSYLETLRSASMDGVDVRLLVPAATDIPVMNAISRSGYRGLLEAGVRIYEWNGSMLHAKTAVIDGYWSRVGSTNLNIASWLSNCEIDILVEDAEFGKQMQEMYLADLENATEISLDAKKKAQRSKPRKNKGEMTSSGSTARFAPSFIAVGSALGSSISKNPLRSLGRMEAKISLTGGFLLLVVGVAAIFFPRLLAIPLGIILIWLAISLFINSYRLFWEVEKKAKSVKPTKADIQKTAE